MQCNQPSNTVYLLQHPYTQGVNARQANPMTFNLNPRKKEEKRLQAKSEVVMKQKKERGSETSTEEQLFLMEMTVRNFETSA